MTPGTAFTTTTAGAPAVLRVTPDGDSPTDTGAQDAPAPKISKTYDQDAVTAMMTREKDQGRRSREREILEALGFPSLDEAKQWTAQRREEDVAKLSDAERAQREAEAAAQRATELQQQAAADRLAARIERTLIRSGVPDTALGRVTRLISVAPDADDEAVTSAVDELKAEMPTLFGAPPAVGPPAPSGGPSGTPPRPTPSGDAYQRGRERAQALLGEPQ